MQHKRPAPEKERAHAPYLSIGIIAWNEEKAIESTIRSLLQQSVFDRLKERGQVCQVFCVANGCTDQTAQVAAQVFSRELRRLNPDPEAAPAVQARVVALAERGKMNAWNEYVHRFSAPGAQFLFMMDADIQIHQPDTIWNMLRTLEEHPEVTVAVDRPRKHLDFKPRLKFWERISLSASLMTQSAEGQLCGQLYGMRASVARDIYIPKDLSACEDGFLKAMVCTDSLTGPVRASRIRVADGAEHTFEAYTSPMALLKNQKRQIIGQTMIHILVDKHLGRLPLEDRIRLAEKVRSFEADDPAWVKRLVSHHLRDVRWFWRLYPGLLGHRFRRLAELPLRSRITCLPAALLASGGSFVASFLAYRLLKKGCIQYWPKAERVGFNGSAPVPAASIATSGANNNLN